jgi:hypothetical protein
LKESIFRIAADAFDHRRPLACMTYESIQLFYLCFDALPKFFLEQETCRKGESTTIRFKLDTGRRWSDGSPVTPADISRPLERVLSSSNPVRNLFFRHVVELSCEGDILALRLARPSEAPLLAMELPVLSPRRGDLTHHYTLTSARPEELKLTYCGPPADRPKTIQILRVRDPLENIHLQRSGLIDVTCDTAFPFDLLETLADEVQVHETGLHMIVRYGPRFDHDHSLRQTVHRVLTEAELPPILAPFRKAQRGLRAPGFGPGLLTSVQTLSCRGLARAKQSSARRPDRIRIRLLHDDFYPNTLIARILADGLEAHGFEPIITLKDFYESHTDFDLRLEILCSKANSTLLRYSMQLEFGALRSNESIAREYLRRFSKICEVQAADQHLLYDEIDDLLDANAVYTPICFIPSISLGADNPLVLGLSKASFRYRCGASAVG